LILTHPNSLPNLAGVHVGQQFLSRAEMVIIGLHQHWLNGINYIGVTKSATNEFSHLQLPIAVSIVMSGGYEDDVDNSDDLIYTGQGGNNLTGDRRQIKDQEMTKGNLALVLELCLNSIAWSFKLLFG
jgi:euchromatic histone-lysine N-methyltransferase